MKRYPFEPDWCVKPGATLAEWIEESKLPMSAIARITGMTQKRLNEIIGGKPITKPDAEKLSRLPMSPTTAFWMGMEQNYRAALARGAKDCDG